MQLVNHSKKEYGREKPASPPFYTPPEQCEHEKHDEWGKHIWLPDETRVIERLGSSSIEECGDYSC
jgi:hypothetical protein